MNGDFMFFINLFFLNSFLGFIMETSLKYLLYPNMHNGILFGPWVPLYGFGALFIYALYSLIEKKLSWKKIWKVLLLFVSVVVFLSLLEWLGGTLIEFLFHKEFWDYGDQKFHLGPYISLGMSLLWGFLSLVFVFIVLPLEKKLIKKIPRFFTIGVSILFPVDCVVTYFLIS